jgi:hypothetical protein
VDIPRRRHPQRGTQRRRRPKEEYGLEPQGLDEIRTGCYDVDERIKDMNAGGVLASMNFPSFPGPPRIQTSRWR